MSHESIFNNVDQVLTMFASTGNPVGPGVRFNTGALVNHIPVYYLAGASRGETMAVLTALTLCGKSLDPTPVKWQTLVCTWSCILFPELVGEMRTHLTTGEYKLEPLSTEFVQQCYNAIKQQETNPGDVFLTFPSGLPNAGAFPVNTSLASTIGLESSYQYFGLLIFIMGKSLNPDTVSAISTRRPEALMRKYNSRRPEYITQGEGRITTENYTRIKSGWIRSSGPRRLVVTHLANLYASDNPPEVLDPVVVMMDMLRHSGQTYIVFIYELVVAHPWCIKELHPLRASWQYYSKIVTRLAAQPSHIRPFYKLMMQDLDKDIRRKEIEPLIAVAIFYAGQTREKMNQYRVDTGSQMVIKLFIDMAAKKGHDLKMIVNQATTETTAI